MSDEPCDKKLMLDLIARWQTGQVERNVQLFHGFCWLSLDTFEEFAKNNRLWIPDMECLRKYFD